MRSLEVFCQWVGDMRKYKYYYELKTIMLTLYVKTGCPFCQRVKATIAELGIEDKIEERNIADEGVAEELVEKGGKRQV